MHLSIKSSDTKQIQLLSINSLFWGDVLDFIQKCTFWKLQADIIIVLQTNIRITNKVVLTLITMRNHQKVKLLPFIFYLQIFNLKIVSVNLVAKNGTQKKLHRPESCE